MEPVFTQRQIPHLPNFTFQLAGVIFSFPRMGLMLFR
jgi:hypothetical protein